MAPAKQHEDRETRNENDQKSANDTSGDHGETRAERRRAHIRRAADKPSECQSAAAIVSLTLSLTFYPDSQRDQVQSTCEDTAMVFIITFSTNFLAAVALAVAIDGIIMPLAVYSTVRDQLTPGGGVSDPRVVRHSTPDPFS